jgi:glucosamine--fructose-6-phosphate aminotransferase (isomerizing)
MCGIVGYIGPQQAAPILLDGLSKLEYRGYDSAGIAVRNGSEEAQVVKATGKLVNLSQKTNDGKAVEGTCGIGHTRWATHGMPTQTNAHPHVSGNCTGSASGPVESEVVGVHNGIIENYQELKEKLLKNGYTFYSQTDTEVVIKLIDYYYKKYQSGPIDAIAKAMVRVRGSYALELMFSDYPEEIYVARKDSPMIIGVAEGETFIASDVPAILNRTRQVYYIGNLELARITAGDVIFYNLDGDEIQKELVEIEWDAEAAEKGGFEHFMMKEIHEQPEVIEKTLNHYLKDGRIDLSATGLTEDEICGLTQIYIVACGSAWHVGVVTQYVMEEFTDLPVRVELASEFRYRKMRLDPHGLVIIISQSGETADSLAALRAAKERGLTTMAIVNVVGSSIAREADHVMYTLAGPEIAVATTKAYSTQLICGYLLSLEFARLRGTLEEVDMAGGADTGTVRDDGDKYAYFIRELQTIPEKVKKLLEDKERIQWFASKQISIRDAFFIGRGIDYAVGLEGSLKMKEISYIHSEAYAAGELKHGTISLIEDGTLVIGILTQPDLYEKTLSNMVECKSRGAYLMGLTTNGNYEIEDSVDFNVYIPNVDHHFVGSLAIIPLQLLGYYTSVTRGLDVDKPRNLAKSVTVE